MHQDPDHDGGLSESRTGKRLYQTARIIIMFDAPDSESVHARLGPGLWLFGALCNLNSQGIIESAAVLPRTRAGGRRRPWRSARTR